jgi:glycine betaine/proline transport system permease protein
VLAVTTLAPFYVVAVLFALLAWRLAGRRFALGTLAALLLCALMGLWPQTMSTLALVLTATNLALLVGIPCVAAGLSPTLYRISEPVMDLIQTRRRTSTCCRPSPCSAMARAPRWWPPSSSPCRRWCA